MPSWRACIHADRHAYMPARMHISRQASIYAGRRAHMQAGHMSRPAFMRFWYACMHACMHACKQSAYMQASMLYAGRHAYMQNASILVRGELGLSAVDWGCPR